MSDRIAVVQNSVGIGGRSKVIAEAIRTIADETTRVDLVTFSDKEALKLFCENYDLTEYDIALRKFSHRVDPPIGTTYQQILLNYIMHDEFEDYDLIFNSNNCLRYLPEETKCLNYVHQPLPAIPEITGRYHVSPVLRAYALPMRLLQRMQGRPDFDDHVTVVNSQFVANQFARYFGGAPDDIVYPPCIESVKGAPPADAGVATLGAFHPNKRQLFQLEVAKSFPGMEFTIMGQMKSSRYFRDCERKIDDESIDNVRLVPNASRETVQSVLRHSRFFLHSMEYEEFGISVVEAINEGCIPVVHDSGGLTEVVPTEELRYSDQAECRAIIETYRDRTPTFCDGVREHLGPFTNETFRQSIRSWVETTEPDNCQDHDLVSGSNKTGEDDRIRPPTEE